MEEEKVDIIDLVKKYLRAVGIEEAKINENTDKVLRTVILKTAKKEVLDKKDEESFESLNQLIEQSKEKEAEEALASWFKGADQENFKESFLVNLSEYLLDLADHVSEKLDDKRREELAALIQNNL